MTLRTDHLEADVLRTADGSTLQVRAADAARLAPFEGEARPDGDGHLLTGPLSPANAAALRAAAERALPPALRTQTAVFHLRGGIDYARLGPVHRAMMAALRAALLRRPEDQRSEEDRALLQLDGYDCLAVVRSQTYNSEGVMFECTQSRHYPGIFRFQSNAVRQHVTATPRKAPATTTSR